VERPSRGDGRRPPQTAPPVSHTTLDFANWPSEPVREGVEAGFVVYWSGHLRTLARHISSPARQAAHEPPDVPRTDRPQLLAASPFVAGCGRQSPRLPLRWRLLP
jgi:hypothetical protein